MKKGIRRPLRIALILSLLLTFLALLAGCNFSSSHLCYTEKAPQLRESFSPTCRSEGVMTPHYVCDDCREVFKFGQDVKTPRTPHNMKDGYCTECGGFESSDGLEFELNEDGNGYTLVGLGNFSGDVPTVDIYNGLCVTDVKSDLGIERVVLGSSAASSAAFRLNTVLKELTLILDYDGTYLPNQAFLGCTSLEKLDFVSAPPGIVTEEEDEESSDASPSMEVFEFIPYSLYILDEAFSGCTSLKTVTLPMTKVYFYSRSFADCSSLESVTPTDAIYGIKEDSFVGCLLLEPIQLEGH